MRTIAPFVLSGACGFVADASVLHALTAGASVDPLPARLVSFSAAVLVTWTLNRRLTFGPSDRPVLAEGARYSAVAIAVGLFNYLTYAGLLLAWPGLSPVAALAASSAAATTLSFIGYSRLVFGQGR